MKKLQLLFIVGLLFALCSCGVASAPPTESVPSPAVSETPPVPTDAPVVPEYSVISSSEYIRDGNKCMLYRVEVADETSESDMRLVYKSVTEGDSYFLHSVAFYGLASDVDNVGVYTVGMLEEGDTTQRANKYPTYTAPSVGKETLYSLRGSNIDGFVPAPVKIYTVPASENGLGNCSMYIDGVLDDITEVGGYEIAFISTEDGLLGVRELEGISSLYGLDVDNLGALEIGSAYRLYFQYIGYSDATKTPIGTFCGAVAQ